MLRRSLDAVVAKYMTVDARTLGLFRIVFGVFLLLNLYDRTKGGNAVAFFTNDGVLPNHGALWSPVAPNGWGFMFGVSTPAEMRVAMLGIVFVYVAYLVGWRTGLMKWLVVLALVSLDNRNLLLQNGGVVVTNVAAVWTAFLPLGERFSLDALKRPVPPRDAGGGFPIVRLAYALLVVDFALIYYFNTVHKSGATWRDGSAVHWVLWQNRVATGFSAWLRMHEPAWFSPLATHGTRIVEGALPVLILSPWLQTWTRRLAIACVVALHGGIASMMTLGPFSYVMMCLSVLLVGPEDWALLERRLGPRIAPLASRLCARLEPIFGPRREPPAPTPIQAELAGVVPIVRGGLTLLVAFAVATQILYENRAIPDALRVRRRPELAAAIIDYLRIPQGWMMFAPDAPRDDGTLVVDGVLADGTHVDPFTGRAPDFEAPLHGPWGLDQQWCDYFMRVSWDGSRNYWPFFGDYLLRMHRLPGAKVTQPIVGFGVYWVSNLAPPPGSTTPTQIRRKFLFDGGRRTSPAPATPPQSRAP